ncbi:MAG TPA: sigma-70 family RNA polymerase sigma factor [Vicinamibacterales bacterium]|nr:sigma-70 family RNA polymerase sigma factor [Vicinamibacterales bacterium]
MEAGRTLPSRATDVEIAERCRRGDAAAFEELYRRHAARLYNLACRMLGTSADAEDAVQEVFLTAYRRIASYRGEAALGTWLYRLAVNHCVDRLRGRIARDDRATDPLDTPGAAAPSVRPDRLVERLDLEAAILRLPDGCRTVFVLHDVEGLEHREIAGLLGISEGTSKSQLHKARLRLRALLRGGAAGEA